MIGLFDHWRFTKKQKILPKNSQKPHFLSHFPADQFSQNSLFRLATGACPPAPRLSHCMKTRKSSKTCYYFLFFCPSLPFLLSNLCSLHSTPILFFGCFGKTVARTPQKRHFHPLRSCRVS
jgi:hypothetical protein